MRGKETKGFGLRRRRKNKQQKLNQQNFGELYCLGQKRCTFFSVFACVQSTANEKAGVSLTRFGSNFSLGTKALFWGWNT